MFNDVNFDELTVMELKNIFKNCNLWKVKIKKDFKKILCKKRKSEFRTEKTLHPNEKFYKKYAGTECIITQDYKSDGFIILSDNNYAITYECFEDEIIQNEC